MSPFARNILLLGAGFLVVLLVVTLQMTSTPLELSADERGSAQRACQGSVRERLPGARFPYDARIDTREDDGLLLSGSVDEGSSSGAVRRNYECFLRRADPGEYLVDSVAVWQSH